VKFAKLSYELLETHGKIHNMGDKCEIKVSLEMKKDVFCLKFEGKGKKPKKEKEEKKEKSKGDKKEKKKKEKKPKRSLKIYIGKFCSIFDCKEIDYWKFLQTAVDMLGANPWHKKKLVLMD